MQALSALDETGEPDMSKMDWEKIKTETNDMEISLKKEKDHWVLADPENVLMRALGFDGLDSME